MKKPSENLSARTSYHYIVVHPTRQKIHITEEQYLSILYISCQTRDGELDTLQAPTIDAILSDGALLTVVQMLGTKSFQYYADKHFTIFILSQLQKANRIDVVWDVYISDSLKAVTRGKIGKGVRKRIASSTNLQWKDFLHANDNKTELFFS